MHRVANSEKPVNRASRSGKNGKAAFQQASPNAPIRDGLFHEPVHSDNDLFSADSTDDNELFSGHSRTDYRRIFQKNPLSQIVINASGDVVQANEAAIRLLAHSGSSLNSHALTGFLKSEDRPAFILFLAALKNSSSPLTFDGKTDKTGQAIRITGQSDEQQRHSYLVLENVGNETIKQKVLNDTLTGQIEQLQNDKQFYQLAIERSDIGLWKATVVKEAPVKTLHFHFSEKSGDIFGFVTFADISFTSFIESVHPDSVDKILIAFNSAVNSKNGFDIEIRVNKPNGDFTWVNWKCYRIEENADGKIELEGTALDITSHKTTEKALAIASNLFENNRDGIFIADQDGRITVVNHQFTRMTGLSQEKIMGNPPWYLQPDICDGTCYHQLCDVIVCADHAEMAAFEKNRREKTEPTHLTMKIVRDMDNRIISYIGVLLDISQNDFLEDHTRYMIEHDFLTGLPNRILLLDRLGQTLIAAERNQRRAAVMFLDLDKFKHINDTLGHAIGDRLLQQVAMRLTQCVRKNDTVSRQGGDEFVILLNDIGNVDDASIVANNIMHTLSQNYQIENYEMSITPSIGIALFPEDGKDIDTLLKNADTAMYHAKENGRNAYQFFNAEMNRHLLERTRLENDLKLALQNGDFFLEYQPIVETKSERMTGVEALLRWNHPQLGILTPSRFLTVAEESGLIGPIGEWVIKTACKQAAAWRDQGFPKTVSINLSSIQLKQKNLLATIDKALRKNRLTPDFLELQITENSIMENIKTVTDLLHQLRNMGIRLVLDNFGNGCSSISHLKKAPIEKIKIDPVFIHALGTGSEDADVAGAIVALAKNLRLKVSAGGVETGLQAERLKEIGCDEYQGYLVSPSLPAREVSHFQLPN